jgi:hypothetical protein
MKKIIMAIALLFAIGLTLSAQQPTPQPTQPTQQDQQTKFFYYPSSNIYYNPTTSQYWYYDEPTTKWMEVKTLPETITVEKTPVVIVYYSGEDVWKDNATHQKKYKGKKDEKKDEPKKDKQ